MTAERANTTKDRTSRRRQRQVASPSHVRHETRIAQALGLRIEGLRYRAIGARLGVSCSQAHDLVLEGLRRLEETSAERAEECRRLELERLDLACANLLRILGGGRTSTNRERIQAARASVLVSESRRRLLGLDASEKRAPVVVYSNPLAGLTQEQLEHIAETGELPEGVSLRGYANEDDDEGDDGGGG